MADTLTTLRTALDSLFYLEMTARTGSSQLPESLLQAQAAITDLRTLIASMEAQEPYAYCVYFPKEQRQEYCQELDELCDDLTNLEHEITPLYTHPAQPSEPKAELIEQARLGMGDGLNMALAVVELYGMKGDVIYTEIAKLRETTQPKSEPAHDDLTIAYMSGFHDGKKAKAKPVQEPLTVESAHAMGAKGATPTEAERLLFEAWMRGHCWAVDGDWNGSQYVHANEKTGFVHGGAMNTRSLWAAWRDRAALAAPKGRKPLTEQKIYYWWSVDNGMEDCDMARLADFRQVVRAVEAALDIEGGAA